MKTTKRLFSNYRQAWARHTKALRAFAKMLDPATGGHPDLVRNWGNDMAKAMIARLEARWRRYSIAFDQRYSDTLRNEEIARGFNPIW